MLKANLVRFYEDSFRKHWDLPALANYNESSLTYGQMSKRIVDNHKLFEALNIKAGDKIAVLGKNSVNWAITYLSAITYGAVIVPILPDFHAKDIHHIVNHSDSKLLFCADGIFEKIDEGQMTDLTAIFSLDNLSLLFAGNKNAENVVKKNRNKGDSYSEMSPEDLKFPEVPNDKLAAIVYTSGTTGFSKGVMLSHNSLISNIVYGQEHMPLDAGDKILSFLPLAHAYGCTFEFLYPLTLGCFITFLGKVPSPKIILKAFGEIKPSLILSVPLIIEKIYKKQIKPMLDKGAVKLSMKLPPIRKLIGNKVNKKLTDAFGANFREIVIGGAALNAEVEEFLREIKFPFTVGYGMTECGPLISYASFKENRPNAVGTIVDNMEVRIDSEDPINIVGEIQVRGENVMEGYYKNEKATKEAIDAEGWLHTGDLGLLDEDGFIYIKGRSKSMILGPSGHNIYPEELEAKINNLPYVGESLVVERAHQLVALVYPDYDMLDEHNKKEEQIEQIMEKNRKKINEELPAYSKISKIEIYPEEFEKTPTRKIKRFLYNI